MPSFKNGQLTSDDGTEDHIRALVQLAVVGSLYRDVGRKFLFLRIGKRQISWYFNAERMVRGHRTTTAKLLGHWPAVKSTQAIREADKIAGRVAANRQEPGRRSATKFSEAFARYILHLRKRSADKGKPALYAKLAERTGELHLLPKWGRWTLAEISNSPIEVADWHAQLTVDVGPVAANRCAKLVRATYRYAQRLNRGLPLALPTSGVDFNKEQQREVPVREFQSWVREWCKVPNANHRAFHLLNLASGTRPGELARLRWPDVLTKERVFIIRNAKAGADLRLPMSVLIVRALKLARDSVVSRSEFVFPSARGPIRHVTRFTRYGLPFYANQSRHVYRTLCVDCGIEDTIAHLLLGHTPQGVSQKYMSTLVLSQWPTMRAAQRKISSEIIKRLGLGVSDLQ
jgi:integrase